MKRHRYRLRVVTKIFTEVLASMEAKGAEGATKYHHEDLAFEL